MLTLVTDPAASRPMFAAAEEPYDGERVIHGIVLGCVLGASLWFGLARLVRWLGGF